MDPLGDLPSMEDEDLDIDMCGAPEELTATGLVVLMDVHALSDWSEHGTKTADDTCRACHRRPRLQRRHHHCLLHCFPALPLG